MGSLHELPHRHSIGESLKYVPDPDGDLHDAVVTRLDAARVRRLLGSLPPLERRVVIWRFGLAGGPTLSHRRIAERLGMAPSAVRTIEKYALNALRASADRRDYAA
jgi:RNA polymerase sporulation-specific sigma factor